MFVNSYITWGNVVRMWWAPGIRSIRRCHWGMLGNPFHTESIHSNTLYRLSTLCSNIRNVIDSTGKKSSIEVWSDTPIYRPQLRPRVYYLKAYCPAIWYPLWSQNLQGFLAVSQKMKQFHNSLTLAMYAKINNFSELSMMFLYIQI